MIFFRTLNYLKYLLLWHHRRGHGIHSPFAFDLVSRIFRNKINAEIVCYIEKVRKRLISDNSTLCIRDLGSCSGKTNTQIRKVSYIARKSPVKKKYGVLLANLAAEFGESGIIEFGTSFGISTMYLAGGYRDAKVYTMEGCPSISSVARKNFEESVFNNISLFTGSFDEMLPLVIDLAGNPGLVFIDGNHRKDPLINYFCRISEISGPNTLIVIDDIHNSAEMEEAWKIIRENEKVTLTIDIWRMGLVFFRKGIPHSDYKIKY